MQPHRVIKTVALKVPRQPKTLHDSEVQMPRTMPGPYETNGQVRNLEMSFLHGSVKCLWCVLRNDVEQFLSHVCV